MKKQNKFKVFFVIILISVIITFNFTISFNTRGQISLQENMEAIAGWEENFEEAKKVCTASRGICYFAGDCFFGISVAHPVTTEK